MLDQLSEFLLIARSWTRQGFHSPRAWILARPLFLGGRSCSHDLSFSAASCCILDLEQEMRILLHFEISLHEVSFLCSVFGAPLMITSDSQCSLCCVLLLAQSQAPRNACCERLQGVS